MTHIARRNAEICHLHPVIRITQYPRRYVPINRNEASGLSAVQALLSAWDGTVRLLLRPFASRRWITLSILCLFLGGGSSTAAFQWAVGALPVDFHPHELLARARLFFGQHWSLSVLAAVATAGLALGLIYVRCVLRFVFIEAVIKYDVAVATGWKSLRHYGRSYFFWILGVAVLLSVTLLGAVFVSYRYLLVERQAGPLQWAVSFLFVAELLAIVCAGLLGAVVITLMDDLVAPVMYAASISLPAAWRTVWKIARQDSGMFFSYVVLRLAVGTGISVAVLVVLFVLLMGLSSGVLVTTALGIFALRALGQAWTWNPVTMLLGAVALSIFTTVLFALLGVAGMPGQVYLQNYGIRFIASRVPALQNLCRAHAAEHRQRTFSY